MRPHRSSPVKNLKKGASRVTSLAKEYRWPRASIAHARNYNAIEMVALRLRARRRSKCHTATTQQRVKERTGDPCA